MHSKSDRKCEICFQVFETRKNLLNHYKESHLSVDKLGKQLFSFFYL
jgi:uncharacterized C2H2 Zn-finger protein